MISLSKMLVVVAAAVVFGSPALADPVRVGDLELTGLWTRATPPNAPTGAGYVTITNTGDTPDRLVSVKTPVADMSQIHQMKVVDGVMTMRPVEGGLEIPGHGSVTLAPGGFHLMFMGLKQGIMEGSELPVTLTFERNGPVEIDLKVYPVGSPGPGAGQ
jgi:periplasmic copper chaperone A